MAKARFESYVDERVAEIAAAKRAKLKAAYDAEVAKIERQRDRYAKMVEDGIEALVRKIVAQAVSDGCAIGETDDAKDAISKYAKCQMRSVIGPQEEYDYDSRENRWPKGTPVQKAQGALKAFDTLCAKEAKRITVYKMDLGMKPEAFEKMLAESAARINRE